MVEWLGQTHGVRRVWNGKRLRRRPNITLNKLRLSQDRPIRIQPKKMSILTSPASEDAFVAQQFDDIEQQREAAKLGMWIFLATEVLFFGGLFLGYMIYRFTYCQYFMVNIRMLV